MFIYLSMIWIIYLFIFITGTAFGSFFNVCIWRIPRQQSIVSPSSHCPQCGTNIKPWHNIPLLSYLLLKGKCRYCGSKIKFNYLIVELLTPIVWVLLFWRFGNSFSLVFFKYLLFFSVGIIIFFIDLYHQLIPDILSIPLLLAGLAFALFPDSDISFWKSFAGAAAGFAFFYILALAVSYSLNKEALGGGDIKFIATTGAFVGTYGVLFTIFIASAIAIAVVFSTGKDRSKEIPFGPFLISGAFIHVMLGDWLIGTYLHLFY